MDFLFLLIIVVLCAIVSAMIMTSKGISGVAGFFLGLILGPLGLIIAYVIPKNIEGIEKKEVNSGKGRKCPFCAEIVKQEAIVCKHCGKDLPEIVKEKPVLREGEKACGKCGEPLKQGYALCEACGHITISYGARNNSN